MSERERCLQLVKWWFDKGQMMSEFEEGDLLAAIANGNTVEELTAESEREEQKS